MKSIKPGRGPSMIGGFMSLVIIAFGLIWTANVAQTIGGSFALFGVVFICAGVASAIYNFKNASSQNRYSSFDITEEGEEPDPLNELLGNRGTKQDVFENQKMQDADLGQGNRFCPYCGTEVGQDFEYCNKCGKKI